MMEGGKNEGGTLGGLPCKDRSKNWSRSSAVGHVQIGEVCWSILHLLLRMGKITWVNLVNEFTR